MDYIFLVLFGLIVLISVLKCAIRGRKRSLVRLVFVLAAAAIALLLTPAAAGYLSDVFPIWELDRSSSLMEAAALCPTLGAAVHGANGAVYSILIYPVLFAVLCLILSIPVSIVNRKTERDRNGAGALVGLLIGVLGFSLAFAPLCTVFDTLLDIAPAVIQKEWDIEDLNQSFGLSLDPDLLLRKDMIVHPESLPGRPMLDRLTTVRENGKTVCLSKELRQLLPLAGAYLQGTTDPIQLLPVMAECAGGSDFANKVFDELQDAAREKWARNEKFLSFDPLAPDGGLGEFLASEILASETNLPIGTVAEKLAQLLEPEQ